MYACDGGWWTVHHDATLGFAGQRWTQCKSTADKYGLEHIKLTHQPGLGKMPGIIHGGGNSGYQVVNLVYHLGAAKIILLGYDMQRTGGQSHWFGDHKQRLRNTPEKTMAKWPGIFTTLVRDLEREGVEVINCTRETALKAVSWQPLEAVCSSI